MIRIRRKLHILGETGKGHKINLHKIGARKKFAEAQEILVSVRNAKGSLKLLARGGGERWEVQTPCISEEGLKRNLPAFA